MNELLHVFIDLWITVEINTDENFSDYLHVEKLSKLRKSSAIIIVIRRIFTST